MIVTGAAGFIGSVVAANLASRGWLVTAVDALGGDGRFRNLSGVPLAGYWDRDELLPALAAGRIRPAPEAILHLGACSSTLETDAGFLLRNNFAYSRDLAEWALAHGIHFVYASSAATYGNGESGFDDGLELLPLLRPVNAYAFSKHVFDLWAWQSGAFSGGGAITGLKYFNIYGPNEYHKAAMRSMVLKAFEQIQADGRLRLFKSYRPEFADGEQVRDFLYVEDAAAITAWFLDHPEATGIFNVGSGVARSWNALARAVFAALERPEAVEYIEMPPQLRLSYQYTTRAELARLRTAGCTLPPRSLEEGVACYVRRFLLAHNRYFVQS